MPYAADDRISKAPLTGGVEISNEEYNQAREHLLSGGLIKAHSGQMILTQKPEKLPDHQDPIWKDGDWHHEPIEPETKTLEELAKDKRRQLDSARDEAFATGTQFAFPGGNNDYIQTRPQDKANLLAIAMEARDLKAAGESDPVIDFRAGSNTTYQLTPNQAIDMANAAMAYVKATYEKSWQLKDSVEAALEAEDQEAIEAITW